MSLREIAASIQNLMATLSALQIQEVRRLITQAVTQYQRGNRITSPSPSKRSQRTNPCETTVAPKLDGSKDFVLDQLNVLHGLTCRAMFGRYGLYYDSVFFGIVHKGRLYFKTNATQRHDIASARCNHSGPTPSRPSTPNYEVPVDALEDAEELMIWAQQTSNL